jgi:hypothetical protein
MKPFNTVGEAIDYAVRPEGDLAPVSVLIEDRRATITPITPWSVEVKFADESQTRHYSNAMRELQALFGDQLPE